MRAFLIRKTRNVLVLAFMVSLTACNQPVRDADQQPAEQYISVPGSVAFDIQPTPASDQAEAWLATYTCQGRTAKFKIEFGPAKAMNDKEFNMKSGEGKFVADPSSDASALLRDLKRALVAKNSHPNVRRAKFLPFTFVSFEPNESQDPDGGFRMKPRGNWTPMKIFIGEGEDEGQVYLNINPALKKGQFSIKDEDYGDIVLSRLAEVL